MSENQKKEFWETNFVEKQEMWGLEPVHSAILAKHFFLAENVKSVLVPGYGYGRNAQVFKDAGMTITGIEISKTAIEMAQKHYGNETIVYHGSVTDMPFDNQLYDGIFCYGLIHLLDENERQKLIQNCYNQLREGGSMIFGMISKEAHTYGTGKFISKDRYELVEGAKIYFYDEESIRTEFGCVGLFEILKVAENMPFYFVKCRKS